MQFTFNAWGKYGKMYHLHARLLTEDDKIQVWQITGGRRIVLIECNYPEVKDYIDYKAHIRFKPVGFEVTDMNLFHSITSSIRERILAK